MHSAIFRALRGHCQKAMRFHRCHLQPLRYGLETDAQINEDEIGSLRMIPFSGTEFGEPSVYEVANLREGSFTDFDCRQIGAFWAPNSALELLDYCGRKIGPEQHTPQRIAACRVSVVARQCAGRPKCKDNALLLTIGEMS